MPDTESGTQPVMSAHNVLRFELFCQLLENSYIVGTALNVVQKI